MMLMATDVCVKSSEAISKGSSNRLQWVDCAKGICIILVVYGHVASGLTTAGLMSFTSFPAQIAHAAQLIRMPTMFFLSGLFLRRSVQKGARAFLRDKLGTLLYPAALWTLVHVSSKELLGNMVNVKPDFAAVVEALPWRPFGELWFLYVLFAISVIMLALYRLGLRPIAVLFATLAMYLIGPTIGTGFFLTLVLSCKFAIYVGLGYYLASRFSTNLIDLQRGVCLVFAVLLLALEWLLAPSVATASFWFAPVLGFLGGAGIIAASKWLESQRISSAIVWVGSMSLQIYLAHPLATAGLRIGMIHLLGIHQPISLLLAGWFGGVFFPIGLVWLANKTASTWIFSVPRRKMPVYSEIVKSQLSSATSTKVIDEQAPQTQSIDVSVVIVSFNTRKLTLDCLSALYADLPESKLEVWVVDNGSSDGTVKAIGESFPSVRIIVNAHNVGFGAASNQAMQRSTGEFLLLLNSDAFVLPGAVNAMIDAMRRRPKVAVVGPKLLNADRSLQPSCYRFPSPTRAWLENLWFSAFMTQESIIGDYRRWPHDKERDVDWVAGACMLVRRSVYGQLGGFDERFFMYAEETDWQLRMRDAGWSVRFDPAAEVVHLGGASVGEKKANISRHFFDSLDKYELKHHGRAGLLSLRLAMIVGCALRAVGWAVLLLVNVPKRDIALAKLKLHIRLVHRQATHWHADLFMKI